MKRSVAALCIVLSVLILRCPAWSADPVAVRAEGMAAVIEGNTARAREEATRHLYRDAVEKALGAYVQGITEMKDFAVVRDRVFSQSQGIVTSTKNLAETLGQDGILRLTAD